MRHDHVHEAFRELLNAAAPSVPEWCADDAHDWSGRDYARGYHVCVRCGATRATQVTAAMMREQRNDWSD